MSIDFSKLSKPQMIEEVDFEIILNERKEQLIQKWETEADQTMVRQILARESEPLTKFLEENAYRETILRNRINQAAQATLLAFATKTDLDAVVANFGITRLLISEATDTSSAVYESDEALRHRTSLVFDALSVAGPTSAYEYHALSADGRVVDAKALSPKPCEALVVLLQADTETGAATPDLINKVQKYLSDDKRRPVADRLTVQSVEVVTFDLQADLFTDNTPDADGVIKAAYEAVHSYMAESKRIGRSIYLSQLYKLLQVEGLQHCVIKQPTADIIISDTQVANCKSIILNTGEN